ncbi:MAG TPA: LuxR C-terminal-related transcriptional regulator [Thermoanaerobaculia bacterium]|nr:LuxR C-terminal-related transcriptional regulator [Thermoanaerobaculia bacterium]
MNPLSHIKGAIEGLSCDRLEAQKQELLSLIDGLAAFVPTGNGDGKHQRLSPREREVMNMILSGRRLKEIAANLDISVKTVTTHRSRLLRKLGLEDNLGLYRYGVRHGLISV